MDLFKCPGSQTLKQPVPEYIECPFCKEEVEIWSDEARATCPSCKNVVPKEMKSGCWEWCKFAEKCLGADLLEKLQAEKAQV
ncbi:MAG: phosphohydrolase [Dehalococcoidia bacterium]|nr:phosphohydrolase [Dehalococcoidia bacterium]